MNRLYTCIVFKGKPLKLSWPITHFFAQITENFLALRFGNVIARIRAPVFEVGSLNKLILSFIKLFKVEPLWLGIIGAKRTGYSEEFRACIKCNSDRLWLRWAKINSSDVESITSRVQNWLLHQVVLHIQRQLGRLWNKLFHSRLC
jgi:hypothetical protein